MHNQPDPDTRNSTIFITGATGFIGQNLVAGLLSKGFRVRALIRPGRCHDQRLPPGCEQVSADITDTGRLAEIVSSSTATIYCAGSVRGRCTADFAQANVNGVMALADVLQATGSRQPLLLLSSLAASQPQLSEYAFSKNAAEQVLLDKPMLSWTILRPPAVYGPGDREMLPLLRLIRRGYVVHPGPREQRLSLLHVDDLVGAIGAWLDSAHMCLHKTYAIDDGTPGGYDWQEIATVAGERTARLVRVPRFLLGAVARANLWLSSLFNYAPMLTPGKVRELIHPRWLCDNHAFMADTDWQPRLDLDSGVRQLFASDNRADGK